ncbi:MAG: lactate utilization protein B, partial [Planctomycetota bacterium]
MSTGTAGRSIRFHRDADARLAEPDWVTRHDRAGWHLRAKRDAAAAATPDWEALRDHAAAVKAHVIDRLPELLGDFIAQARAVGWQVHCIADAAELRSTVSRILAQKQVRRVVKSKSMLTEECGLNPHLEAQGIQVVDTDLGERIIQLRHEPPSHIVIPAIHLSRQTVGETFHTHLQTPAGEDDPERLTRAARASLRQDLLQAQAGITGVNFAIAETGGVVVCTNEGNADLGTALPPLHIACMGVEKLIPTLADLPTFIRLLGRSATGQASTAYTSIFHGPDPRRPGHEAHLLIVDNGRSALHAESEHRRSLSCIRCGACMNTCPVYRRVGGHAYGSTIPGPIGSILTPQQQGSRAARELPFASSLCGSCSNVCPVRIDLHDQLLAWRRRIVRNGHLPLVKRCTMLLATWSMRSHRLF